MAKEVEMVNEEVMLEEEVAYVSTGFALKSIGHNVITVVTDKEGWKRRGKKILGWTIKGAIGAGLVAGAGALYAYCKKDNGNDEEFEDDNIIEGEAEVIDETTEEPNEE